MLQRAFLGKALVIVVAMAIGGCGGGRDNEGAGGGVATGGAGPGGGNASGGSGGGGGVHPPTDGKMPIGIPEPSFGLKEKAPKTPSPWSTATPGFYYVDATVAGATDAGNTYGTPAKPRLTIPQEVPAGAVVELHGTYATNHTSPYTFHFAGTASQPVFIRGVDADHRPNVTGNWELTGGYYVVENIDFSGGSQKYQVIVLAPTTHGAVRDNEIHGTKVTGGLAIASWIDAANDDVVIASNDIHDNGDMASDKDQDFHGISVGATVNSLWVLFNEMSKNSGDGIQISAGPGNQALINHVYVGGNVSHDNRQSGFWSKEASDVIFSQNVAYSHRPSKFSPGDCMGFQYSPEMVWFLSNYLTQCDYGIGTGDDEVPVGGLYSFFIGNVITDIHSTTFSPDTGWGNAGIMLAGGTYHAVVNNTIWDVDSGVTSPGTSGTVYLANNIIGKVIPAGHHVFLEMATLASGSEVNHDLYADGFRVNWGGAKFTSLSGFKSANAGQCKGCLSGDPRFVSETKPDFSLADGSPAIDAGTVADDPVYAIFQQRYGLDIRRDASGLARPQGAAWDLGALEHP